MSQGSDECEVEGEFQKLQKEYEFQKKELTETRRALEELKRENKLKTRECQEAWKSLQELQNELMRKSMHVGSLGMWNPFIEMGGYLMKIFLKWCIGVFVVPQLLPLRDKWKRRANGSRPWGAWKESWRYWNLFVMTKLSMQSKAYKIILVSQLSCHRFWN